jgi:hypothetical protein
VANNNSSSSVASVAIVVLVLMALFVGYLILNRSVSANRGIDIDINVPKHVSPPPTTPNPK